MKTWAQLEVPAKISLLKDLAGDADRFLRASSCTLYGAEFPSKKLSLLRQNLENKGPEIFLPLRSMVLKGVRGKILETLELYRASRARGFEAAPVRQVVKDR
jgi:hypothetical protein